MNRDALFPESIQALTAQVSVSFGITAYNAGNGVLPTLKSLWQGLTSLNLSNCPIILSESHDQQTMSSAPSASIWAHETGARLVIDSDDHRRPLKQALNVIFERANSDV